jgi:HAMP domain-containing protein
VIAAIGVLLAALAVHLLGALALEPLGRLRQAVSGVSGTRDLSRRVPAGDGPVEVDELAQDVNAMLGRLERALGPRAGSRPTSATSSGPRSPPSARTSMPSRARTRCPRPSGGSSSAT